MALTISLFCTDTAEHAKRVTAHPRHEFIPFLYLLGKPSIDPQEEANDHKINPQLTDFNRSREAPRRRNT